MAPRQGFRPVADGGSPAAPGWRAATVAGWRSSRVGTRNAGASAAASAARLPRATQDLAAQPGDGVVGGVHDAFFERDDGVVGDLDVLGAHLGAALGDVAHPEAHALAQQLPAVVGVERMRLELHVADEHAGAGVMGLVVLVVPDHVADVLAHEAFDALAELLAPLDVDLHHPVVAVRHRAGRGASGGTLRAIW